METTQEKPLILEHLREIATRAHNNTSFSPEKRGERVIIDYSNELESDIEEFKQNNVPNETIDKYKFRYEDYLKAYLYSHSNLASTMITGGSNFPVRQQEKRHRWTDNKYNTFREWREKACKAILRQAKENRPQGEKESEIWRQIESFLMGKIETIIEIDNGINTYSSRQLFVSSLCNFIKKMAKNGQAVHVKKSIELIRHINSTHTKPIVTESNKVFQLAEIAQEIKADTEILKQRENKIIPFKGGELIFNFAIDRIQIKHDEKPDKETITKLKSCAMKWSPSQMVWQRQMTNNAKYVIFKFLGLEFKTTEI